MALVDKAYPRLGSGAKEQLALTDTQATPVNEAVAATLEMEAYLGPSSTSGSIATTELLEDAVPEAGTAQQLARDPAARVGTTADQAAGAGINWNYNVEFTIYNWNYNVAN